MLNKLYTEVLYIVHNEYLRHGEKLDVNDLYIDYFRRRPKGSEMMQLELAKMITKKIP